jgi:hypothetical protein
MTDDKSRYSQFPQHPLRNIRQAVLNSARHAMQEAAEARDVDEQMVKPIADMVVMDMLPWLKPEAFLPKGEHPADDVRQPMTVFDAVEALTFLVETCREGSFYKDHDGSMALLGAADEALNLLTPLLLNDGDGASK